MKKIKRWLGSYSELGISISFTLSFIACSRILIQSIAMNRVVIMIISLCLLIILFILTCLRVRYSVIEKKVEKDFILLRLNKEQNKYFKSVWARGNLLLVELQEGESTVLESEISLIAYQAKILPNKLVVILVSHNREREHFQVLNPKNLSSIASAKKVSKLYIATLSPEFGRNTVEELFEK